MTIQEVYEKFKHLDVLLSDKEWLDMSNIKNAMLYDFWKSIKEEVKDDKA